MGFYLLENSPVNGTQWQQWCYPRRGADFSGTIIMHTSESVLDVIGDDSGAEDVARFIANRTGSYGAYHDLVDSDSIVEMAPYDYETWQDSETNPWAVGISAACRTTDWATMSESKREGYYRNLAKCGAKVVRYGLTQGIEIPLKRITGVEARNRVPGFCAHGDSGIARTDPGVNFDWDKFFEYTKQELNGEVEEVTTQAQIDEIVHRVNTFQQTVLNQRSGEIIAEVRVHTAHNARVVLDALKNIPSIPDTLVEEIKAKLEQGTNESVEAIIDKLKNIEITLKAEE